MSNCATILSVRRVEIIFHDCVDTSKSGVPYSDGIIGQMRFHDAKLREHQQEVRNMLPELSSEVQMGNSWRAFMFDLRESQWASSVVATKLIALACAMGFVARYTDKEERALMVPLYELPWYHVIG